MVCREVHLKMTNIDNAIDDSDFFFSDSPFRVLKVDSPAKILTSFEPWNDMARKLDQEKKRTTSPGMILDNLR